MVTLPTIEALGSHIKIEIFDEISEEKAQAIYKGLSLIIRQFENNYSRFSQFKYKSVIFNLNAAGFLLNPDQQTVALLKHGLKLYHETNGIFNFLVSDNLNSSSYKSIYSRSDGTETDLDPTRVLSISDEKILLAKGHVDVDGYSRGYLLDLLVSELKNTYQIQEFFINGNDIMYGTTKYGESIKVSLAHPTKDEVSVGETCICNEGFAISTTGQLHKEVSERLYPDLTDRPVSESHNNALAVYVKATTAVAADAWATTLLISSPENHLNKLQSLSLKVASFNEQENKFKEWGKFF